MHYVSDEESESVQDAVARANSVLPGAGDDDESRWPAVIAVCEYVETNPDQVWAFIAKWGDHEDEDIRDAIACCGLEHLLEYHFDSIFPRVEDAARSNQLFADMFGRCWKFGQSKLPKNAKRFDQLRNDLGLGPSIA